MLALVVTVTYINAFHTELVFDDRLFASAEDYRALGWSGLPGLFAENAWAGSGSNAGLYRPLLLLSIAIDAFLFGDWLPGYHLVNILLHLLACFAVYGLACSVLEATSPGRESNRLCALLAAIVFAVHPVHSEVVNLIFNRSESIVTLGIAGGLWWFLSRVRLRLWLAWFGLALIYLPLLLTRESAVTLPALAVALLWLTSTESWREKLRLCWPVVLLVVPLAVYGAMRISVMENSLGQDAPTLSLQERLVPDSAFAHALWAPLQNAVLGVSLGAPEIPQEPVAKAAQGDGLLSLLRLESTRENMARAVHLGFDGLLIMVWPHPLSIYHDAPTGPPWWALGFQLLLLGAATWGWLRGRSGLLIGLAFYYIAVLPSSRIIAEAGVPAVFNERLFYLPSVGPTLALAFGLGWLFSHFGPRAAILLPSLAAIVMTPMTWARNADWSDEVRLFEADYAKLQKKDPILYTLLGAYLETGDLRKATAICDTHERERQRLANAANRCAQAYEQAGRINDAEAVYIHATKKTQLRSMAYFNLASMYVRLGRHQEARQNFERAVQVERSPALKAFQQGYSLMLLYPYDPVRKAEARAHLEHALELQPRLKLARDALALLEP